MYEKFYVGALFLKATVRIRHIFRNMTASLIKSKQIVKKKYNFFFSKFQILVILLIKYRICQKTKKHIIRISKTKYRKYFKEKINSFC